MIKERPGAPDDRKVYIGNIDCDRLRDFEAFRQNYDKAFGEKKPWWDKEDKINIDK